MQIDPKEQASRNIYHLLTSVVIPRPIAWVSTQSREGVLNLAPFSFFNAITSKPPLLMISSGRRRGQRKDTANNASRTREFVVNIVTESNLDAMVQTAGEYGPEVDEFDKVGLTPVESTIVKPPRVKESLVQMECRTHQIIEVSPGIVDLIIGEVVMFHIDDSLPLDDQLHIPADAIRPVARMGGTEYAFLGDITNRDRPKV
jgi:flavin reductase (DIM6/NTAB) family NADH-FMN oxidoreductase RutF